MKKKGTISLKQLKKGYRAVNWEELFDKNFIWSECCIGHHALFRSVSEDSMGGWTLAQPEYVKAFIRELLKNIK